MRKVIDLTGKKFGAWTVIKQSEKRNKHITWLCKCECGNESVVVSQKLRMGLSKSCGCLIPEKARESSTIHGKCTTPEYRTWSEIFTRCTNPNSKAYQYYGGRGITISERWNNFENFLADMGEKLSPKHSIERIDVNGNYEPNNCKWATAEEQSINKRLYENNTSGHKGVSKRKKTGKWKSYIRVKGKLITLGEYEDIQDAINARKQAEKLYWKSS